MDLHNTCESVCAALFGKGEVCSRNELKELLGIGDADLDGALDRLVGTGILIAISGGDKGGVDALSFAPNLALAGVSIDQNDIGAELWFPASRIRHRRSVVASDSDPVPPAIALLREILKSAPDTKVASLGVAFPGLIDTTNGHVQVSTHFPEFNDRPLANEFVEALGCESPVLVERSAVCDMTHALLFSGRELGDALLVSLKTDLSAAALLDGAILYEKSGKLSELGHLKILGGDIPCVCGGTGCVETVVGRLAWEREYGRLRRSANGLPSSLDEALERGVAEAETLVLESFEALMPILECATTILAPEQMLISSDLPADIAEKAAAFLLGKLQSATFGASVRDVIPLNATSTVDGAADIGACWLAGNPQYSGKDPGAAAGSGPWR